MCEENGNNRENIRNNLELNCTITEMKNSIDICKGRFEQEEESVDLKIGQWKLLRLRKERKKIKEKLVEPKGPVGYHQADPYTHCGSPKREGRERGRENI